MNLGGAVFLLSCFPLQYHKRRFSQDGEAFLGIHNRTGVKIYNLNDANETFAETEPLLILI